MIFVVLTLSIAGMAAIAFWAYRNVAPHSDRLPMQWSADGTVNWRAPRLLAIATTPVLMLTIIGLIFVLSRHDHAERNMALLSTIAYATPLLGLLGTLLGLLTAFQSIALQSGYATAADIANGVYESLLTSTASLAVAIPAFIAYSYLSARINGLAHDMERAAIEILAIFDEKGGANPPS